MVKLTPDEKAKFILLNKICSTCMYMSSTMNICYLNKIKGRINIYGTCERWEQDIGLSEEDVQEIATIRK